MTDLPDRILAAIEETERLARAAIEGPWRLERETRDVTDYWTVVTDRGFLMSDSDSADSPNACHIVRQEPQATLRRCEADKRTVERHHRKLEFEILVVNGVEQRTCDHCGKPWPCPDLLDRADAWDVARDGETA